MYGAMPSDFMVFEVGVEQTVEDTELEQASTPDEGIGNWDINNRWVRICHTVHFVLRLGIVSIYIYVPTPRTNTDPHDGEHLVERCRVNKAETGLCGHAIITR